MTCARPGGFARRKTPNLERWSAIGPLGVSVADWVVSWLVRLFATLFLLVFCYLSDFAYVHGMFFFFGLMFLLII